MGILSLDGSSTDGSSPERNDHVVDPVSTQPSPEDQHLDKPYVKDAFINQNALNIDRCPGVLNALEGFISGSEITVTYYHHQFAATNDQSFDGDVTNSLDQAHSNILRINNFKFKLQAGLDFTYEGEEITSEVRGEGVCYSGFNPVVGDWFLYELEPDIIGRFTIDTTPTRLAINSNTCYNISFRLIDFPDNAFINEMELRVRDIAWFDKQTFLLGNASLLSSDLYQFILLAERKTVALENYYFDKFYDSLEYKSYLAPNAVYDPYLVEFVARVMGRGRKRSPKQLHPHMKYGAYNIWRKLIDPDRVPWHIMRTQAVRKIMMYSSNDTNINFLMNREYMEIIDFDEVVPEYVLDYVFPEINGSNKDTYNNFQKLICSYLNSRRIYTQSLVLAADNYLDMNEMEQFYQIPMIIFLLRESINSVREGKPRTADNVDDNLPRHIEFSSTDLIDGKLKLLSPTTIHPITIKDEFGGIGFIATYTEHTMDGIIINVEEYRTAKEIPDMTAPWTAVISGPAEIATEI